MTNIFDTHAHYSSRQFDADRAALLTALPAGGVVGVLECATHSGDAARVLELAHSAPYFHAAIGIHPESLIEEDAATVAVYHGDWRAELAAMRPLFEDKSVVAVGEIGLDHHWPVPRQEQYDLFEAQLQLAKELDLPVSVHDREAHAEMYELLRKYKPRGEPAALGTQDILRWRLEDQEVLGPSRVLFYPGGVWSVLDGPLAAFAADEIRMDRRQRRAWATVRMGDGERRVCFAVAPVDHTGLVAAAQKK